MTQPAETFRQRQRRLAGSRYRARRRLDYPSTGDQLGALWSAVDKLAGAKGLPPEAQAVLDGIKAVKTRYPKG